MSQRTDIHKVLIIGSGPIIIGQACEFDYSGTQACKALRSLGYEIVLVNSNPATIMTDPEMADVTYIEPLNVKRLEAIIAKERPDALLPNLGGQSGLNLCSELAEAGVLDKYNVKVIGVQVDAIERGEDRIEFKNTMNSLGIEVARSEVAYTVDEALSIADELGYPVVLRPAYTMGGAGGGLVYNKEELQTVCARGLKASLVGQVLVRFPLECLPENLPLLIYCDKAFFPFLSRAITERGSAIPLTPLDARLHTFCALVPSGGIVHIGNDNHHVLNGLSHKVIL